MFELLQKLPTKEELINLFPAGKKTGEIQKSVANVISGMDDRLLLIVGPCSLDDEDATYRYVEGLMNFAQKIRSKFLVLPRLYTSKPRSLAGFRGLIHSPNLVTQDMAGGVVLCRKILCGVLDRFGVCGADELLYPDLFGYFADVLAYVAVGARSGENQQHRMFASGIEIATGFKNPLSGSATSLVNSVAVAKSSNVFSCAGEVFKTDGNPLAHAVFRGYTDKKGRSASNATLRFFGEFCAAQKRVFDGLGGGDREASIPFLVDVSHDNSGKNYLNQPKTMQKVAKNLRNAKYKKHFRGLMLESYLLEGKNDEQRMDGRSNTDACLSLEQTERAVLEFLDKI